MDTKQIDSANKAQLRALCKEHNVAYGKLDNAGMRAALRKLLEGVHRAQVNERFSDTPVFEKVTKAPVAKKAKRLSVTDALQALKVGQTTTVDSIAKKTGALPASVRMLAQSYNSDAPSNARLHKTGCRFDVPRGCDEITRTK